MRYFSKILRLLSSSQFQNGQSANKACLQLDCWRRVNKLSTEKLKTILIMFVEELVIQVKERHISSRNAATVLTKLNMCSAFISVPNLQQKLHFLNLLEIDRTIIVVKDIDIPIDENKYQLINHQSEHRKAC